MSGTLVALFFFIFLIIACVLGAIVSIVDGASGIVNNTEDNFIGSFGSYVDSFGQSSSS